ncbi:hypothetical protein F4Z98_15675 [Candidatus Poribacteria bacterium]|nr:hypothetical protein [Candidatus Poribacteria bacterium]MYB01729.1 hypothetical protein [Candidatus Poribacteria bacterium]
MLQRCPLIYGIHYNRDIFGDQKTQKAAQKALPVLISCAKEPRTILMQELAAEILPELRQFNWTIGYALGWIHRTLYDLERSDDWNYGKIPGITAIVLDKPETPTNYCIKETAPASWKEYETDHILPVFKYPHWDKVMDCLFGSL